MDTFSVFKGLSANIFTDLNSRYTGDSECTDFATHMQALWDNYYSFKVTEWDTNGINSRMATAKADLETPTTGYSDLVGDVGTAFNTALTSFTGAIVEITDPDYGMIAGLNCLLFGEDFKLVIDTTCVRLFNTFYMLRFTLGISAFGILFVMCCSTCSGVRHFKQMERKGKMMPELGSTRKIEDETLHNLNLKQFDYKK